MAANRFSLNEGSLVRRTALHVAVFVLGTALFLAVASLVLTSIGNCHRKLKTFEQGIYYFQRALRMDPDNFYALFGLADCYRGMNQQFRSVEFWNRILDKDPNNKVILTRAGDAYRNMGDYDLAQQYYQRALDIEFDVYAVLGLAMISNRGLKVTDAAQSREMLLEALGNVEGTPREIVRKLHAEIGRFLKLPDAAARMSAEGAIPTGNTPEEFHELIRTETVRWGRVIKAAGA